MRLFFFPLQNAGSQLCFRIFSVNKAGDFVSTETKFVSSNSVSGGTLKHARSITGSSLPTARVTKPEAIPARSQTLTAKGVEDGRKGEKGKVTKNEIVDGFPCANCPLSRET